MAPYFLSAAFDKSHIFESCETLQDVDKTVDKTFEEICKFYKEKCRVDLNHLEDSR